MGGAGRPGADGSTGHAALSASSAAGLRREGELEKSGSLHLPCETVQHLPCENTPARQVRGANSAVRKEGPSPRAFGGDGSCHT
ncbi:zinc finger protein 554 isoform X4 [Cervus elaphus]|uniref:zinc finger protein 554 isoform X3 n=1 Tax=Cervus canadensis TaxID=1574408 RepID=UPI001C9E2590|nr:zinc finger protein 554 isoform X3 [Cervus canadensis]XP_043767988.1 zinc finger protein 554 isoform X4 [Cervus elaphus]